MCVLNDVNDDVMRSYAQDLPSGGRDGEIEASTAITYYGTVRACLTWAVEEVSSSRTLPPLLG
ncbi:hypothetical protein G6M89_20560 [Natronolimnobius sp. AArcel1]|uniref:hypothetical protein n=1 Tax=Natronolimnobius sp. AArcel1 TaxID=1679093 RepID=UPI0013EB452D|nr:hypothetical protein [Natronolimnobius sp. AArcel1]NGM71358.1 hypothetical protein [Natronolimnobius sp. AArcel1]